MRLKRLMYYAFCFLSILANVSCDKSDEPSGSDPTKPVNDPPGTIMVSVRNDNNGGDGFSPSGTNHYIRIDKSDNFYGSFWKFASVGACQGLGNVVSIPISGWTEKTSVREDYGYVGAYVRNDYYSKVHEVMYIRLYVDSYMISTSGGVLGAELKYQTPFNGSASSIKTDAANDLVVLNQKGDATNVKLDPVSYSVSTDEDWINVSADISSIGISAKTNDLATLRTGTVIIKSAALKVEKKLIVQQGGAEPYMILSGATLDKNTLNFTLDNQVVFDINTNSSWDIKSNDSWCTAIVVEKRSNYPGKYNVMVSATDNNTGKLRETSLIISYGNNMQKTETVTVKQDVPDFEVTPDKIELNGKATSTTVMDVTTTAMWTVKSSDSWCSVSPAEAKGSQKVSVVAEENLSGKDRESSLTFAYNGLEKQVKVVQYKSEFELSDQKISMGPMETDFAQFNIKTSMSWTLSTSASWLSVQNLSGSNNAVIKVTGKERNNTGKIRSALLSVKAADGTVKTVTVNQDVWFASGNGRETNPYTITNADEFFCLKYASAKGLYVSIEKNIDLSAILSNSGWESVSEFKGVLKGNNHEILGLWGEPLIGYNYGTISGLNLVLGSNGISGGGAICSKNSGTIKNCCVIGNIIGVTNYVGGICGYGSSGEIQGCSVSGNITGGSNTNCTGGICGFIALGAIRNCSMSGRISSDYNAGGIAGSSSSTIIEECYSEGNIIGSNYVSGISGNDESISISYCYSIATIESTIGVASGISFKKPSAFCYFSGKLIGNTTYGITFTPVCYSYYNSEMTGASQGGIPKNAIEMKKQATYENWDFNTIWRIDEGKSYPQLRCFDK